MGYSPERKAAVLKRMLSPHTVAIRQLSQEEGISEATRHKWRADARGKGQLLPDADAGAGPNRLLKNSDSTRSWHPKAEKPSVISW